MDQDQILCAVMSTDQNVCSFSNKGSTIAGLQKHDFKTTPNNLLISITPFNLRQENTLKKNSVMDQVQLFCEEYSLTFLTLFIKN